MSDAAGFHRTVHGEASHDVIIYIVCAVVVVAVVLAVLVVCYVSWRKKRAARAQVSLAPASPPCRQDAEHSVAVADNVCGMCRATYGAQGAKAPQMLECGHCFHSRCIQRWLRVNLACPTCNKTHIMMCGENRGEVSAPRHRYTTSMGIDSSTSSRDDIVIGRSSFHF